MFSPDFCPRLSYLWPVLSLTMIYSGPIVRLSQSSPILGGDGRLSIVNFTRSQSSETWNNEMQRTRLTAFSFWVLDWYIERSHIACILSWSLKYEPSWPTEIFFRPTRWKLPLVRLAAAINLISLGSALKLNNEASWTKVNIRIKYLSHKNL